jgi:hypothetical protein
MYEIKRNILLSSYDNTDLSSASIKIKNFGMDSSKLLEFVMGINDQEVGEQWNYCLWWYMTATVELFVEEGISL